jgi:CheY-like chemotaxis protein
MSLKKIMIVDDNSDVTEAMEMLLSMDGHEVVVATDGPDALAKARDFEAEVFLIDIGLPGMSGHDLARALRLQPASKDAKMVALTGLGGAEEVARSLAAGFDRHMVKPVSIDTIAAYLISIDA